MHYRLADDEWEALHAYLGVAGQNVMARESAQAGLFRLTSRLSQNCRSFNWALLPAEFQVSSKTAHRYYTNWVSSEKWFVFWDALIAYRYGVTNPNPPNTILLQDASPLVAVIIELERAYHYFNHRFLAGSLPHILRITIEHSTNGKLRGYYARDIWQCADNQGDHIAICQGALTDSHSALATLMHEMAHTRNQMYGMQDTDTRTQYHTIDFRESAQLLGLVCYKIHNRGYAGTRLGQRALNAIEQLQPVESVFSAMKPR